LRAMAVVAESRSGEGAALLARDWNASERRKAFDRVLSVHAGRLLDGRGLSCGEVPVVVSGMASSSVGLGRQMGAGLPSVGGFGVGVRAMVGHGLQE
jgi:hypothetical protein